MADINQLIENIISYRCVVCETHTSEKTLSHRFFMPDDEGKWRLQFVNLHDSCVEPYRQKLK